MNEKLALFLFSILTLGFSGGANSNYIPIDHTLDEKSAWDKVLDIASSWVRSHGKKKENKYSAYYFSGAPTLSQWREGTKNWEPSACLSSNASNSGVWVNHVKEVKTHTENFSLFKPDAYKRVSFKEYFVSANTPYEIESKNFKRAGLKRFADYFHSFRIDEPGWLFSENSTVIDNKKSHNYYAMHTFSEGESWVHSTTFTDFEWSIGIKNSSGDLNYADSWEDPSNYSVRGKWGGDIYLSECGFAKVTTEENTRPVINNFTKDVSMKVVSMVGLGKVEFSALLDAVDVSDYHTHSKYLTYQWQVTHASGSKRNHYGKKVRINLGHTPWAIPDSEIPWEHIQSLSTYDPISKVRLIVSDGDMSTISEK